MILRLFQLRNLRTQFRVNPPVPSALLSTNSRQVRAGFLVVTKTNEEDLLPIQIGLLNKRLSFSNAVIGNPFQGVISKELVLNHVQTSGQDLFRINDLEILDSNGVKILKISHIHSK
ncbi:MAG: hypothetical protein ACE5H1_02990 [Thermodesulfobacteriota bacterium]